MLDPFKKKQQLIYNILIKCWRIFDLYIHSDECFRPNIIVWMVAVYLCVSFKLSWWLVLWFFFNIPLVHSILLFTFQYIGNSSKFLHIQNIERMFKVQILHVIFFLYTYVAWFLYQTIQYCRMICVAISKSTNNKICIIIFVLFSLLHLTWLVRKAIKLDHSLSDLYGAKRSDPMLEYY